VASDDDTWDPFADPEGQDSLRSAIEALTPNERRALMNIASGRAIREVEIDRLVSLGMVERSLTDGEPHLTELGRRATRTSA